MKINYCSKQVTSFFVITFLTLLALYSCNNEEMFINEQAVIEEEVAEEIIEETLVPEDEANPEAPILSGDDVVTDQNTSVEIAAFTNDNLIPENYTLSFTDPTGGVVEINDKGTPNDFADDTVIYSPNEGYFGQDSFEYTVCHQDYPEICSSAMITITVNEVILNIDDEVATELKAFPSAYGAGALATGGRGGQVIHVTNLNDSGPGSFREAVTTTGARIIVFDVSGEINLQSRIYADGRGFGNLTIAGETAPVGGVTITGNRLAIMSCENIIIRYIRFRNVDSDNGDLLSLRGGAGNIIVDHCSFAWGKDEALDITTNGPISNVTVQNCHFYQNKTCMIMGAGSSPESSDVGSFSILRNTSASTSHRFPNFSGDGKLDVINNLIHNWRYRTFNFYSQDWRANVIGNYMQSGGNTLASALNKNYSTALGKDRLVSGIYKIITNNTMSPRLYIKYNHIDQDLINMYNEAESADPGNDASIDLSNYSETNEAPAVTAFGTNATIQPKAEWFSSTQLPLQGVIQAILPASDLKTELLSATGACKTLNADGSVNFWRDSIDTNSVDEIQNDGTELIIPTSRAEFGINPTYVSNSRGESYDSDRDGMPDTWEIAMFGGLNATSNGDHDNDGYTNIEEFMNMIDK